MPKPERDREHQEHHHQSDPYWTGDHLLGELPLPDGPSLVRLRLHQSEEAYDRRNLADLVPLRHPTGRRDYIHAQPYVLAPEFTLTVGLFPTPRASGAIGEVVDSSWEGMRHVAIGQAQAWSYPRDRVLVLWECYLFDRWRRADPLPDPALAALWDRFEAHLLTHFPDTEHIVTPSWEDIYERPAWQAFLGMRGYAPGTSGVFFKTIHQASAR